jgi:hypothetical protein
METAMNNKIPHPYVGGHRFRTLEDLRRAVSDMEAAAREMDVHPDEVLFSEEFLMQLRSDKLTDRSCVLNATMAIAPDNQVHRVRK